MESTTTPVSSSLFQPPTPVNQSDSNSAFDLLRPTCVSLLDNSSITLSNASRCSDLLSILLTQLKSIPDLKNALTTEFIEYVFGPISIILRDNAIGDIPDHVLEKLLRVMAVLCNIWWWNCPIQIWEQVAKLCSTIVGGSVGPGAATEKAKDRDDETKEAACLCLEALLKSHEDEEEPEWSTTSAHDRLSTFQQYAYTRLPLIGPTLNHILPCTGSDRLPLRLISMRLVRILIEDYILASHIPMILPGVVSTTCKVAMGRDVRRGWQSADVVGEALAALGAIIIKSLGDEVCRSAGLAVKVPAELDELLDLASRGPNGPKAHIPPSKQPRDPFAFHRTAAWLQASASQIHLSINTLSPLLGHPTPAAQLALVHLCSKLLQEAKTTLPTLHQLLLSHLLALSLSPFADLASEAELGLVLSLSKPNPILLSALLQLTQENLHSMAPLILAHSDAKVEHSANMIIATCRISQYTSLSGITTGVIKLLGPNGGIEKWGSGLLGVLEVSSPTVTSTQGSVGLILDDLERVRTTDYPFPEIPLKHVSTASTATAIGRMFQALGHVGGPDALYSVEWLVDRSKHGRGPVEASSLWCAVRILEGISGHSLPKSPAIEPDFPNLNNTSKMPLAARKRLVKTCRALLRGIGELWEANLAEEDTTTQRGQTRDGATTNALSLLDDSLLPTEHVKGMSSLTTLIDLNSRGTFGQGKAPKQRSEDFWRQMAVLHSVLALNLLAVSASVLDSRLPPLLLHILYPILRSLVSSHAILSETAMATLQHISGSAGYASPSNLLLANFDYALDSISRRLLRGRLDVKATKVLVLLIRLVGTDVVQRAGDVVEECFDRLNEFHGYGVVVEGLVEVLAEVVKVVEQGQVTDGNESGVGSTASRQGVVKPAFDLPEFRKWYAERNQEPLHDTEDFGPTPHRPWGQAKASSEKDQRSGSPLPFDDEPPKPTITQELILKIITRCLPFLTHSSPLIRTRILTLMRSAVVVLSPSEIQPAIHTAWPFILHRLKDSQPFVVTEAARLIDTLSARSGNFMTQRIWDDVWPAYRAMLDALEKGDRSNALAKRGKGAFGTATQYSTSHRLYVAMLNTINSIFTGVKASAWVQDDLTWEVVVKCRRFLSVEANTELQAVATKLYRGISRHNDDLVWLVLSSTCGSDPRGDGPSLDQLAKLSFLRQPNWTIEPNVISILEPVS